MASTYSNLKIQLMATGENTTTWGDVTNINLGTAIEEAIVGSADVTFASANVTLTLTNTNTTQTARNMRLRCTGTTGGSTRNLVVPSIEKPYIVQNDCADSILVKTAAGSGITVPAGKTMLVYSDGTNVVDVVTYLTSVSLGTPLALASGGVGSNTASGARTNLGATTIGDNLFTLANPSAVTFPRFNADNTVSALNASDFRTAIGAGTSSTTGTVTSVSGAGTVNGLTLTGTVTSSGSITLGGTLTGVNLASAVTGTLPVANGGTGATTASTARTNLSAQETLVSGTNIKTINGTSLLGSGNIDTTTGVIASGIIALWSGSSASIPAGWVLCNGLNGTPDLRNRFIVGAGSTYAVGATGGSADATLVSHTHTATVTDPGHNHTATVTDPGHTHTASVTDPGHFHNLPGFTSSGATNQTQIGVSATSINATSASATTGISVTNASNTTGITVSVASKVTGITVANSTSGSSATNANLPPYYALCYIMKT